MSNINITYNANLNQNISALTFNLENYTNNFQSVTIVNGVNTLDENTVRILYLNTLFAFFCGNGVIVLPNGFNPANPILPVQTYSPYPDSLVAGLKPDGSIGFVALDSNNQIKISGSISVGTVTVTQSDWDKVNSASDTTQTLSYNTDNTIHSIVYHSASLGLTFTKTFTVNSAGLVSAISLVES